jgi:hypothetical protein
LRDVKKMMFRKLLPAALLLASVAAGAQSLPSAPHLTITQRSSFLLLAQETRESLLLTAAQVAAINKAMFAHAQAQSKEFAQKEPNNDKLIAADAAFAAAALKPLTPAQQKSLLKAALKEVGILALGDKQIAERLGLTKDQSGMIGPMLLEVTTRNEDFSEMVAKGFEHFLPPKNEAERAEQAKQKAEIVKSYAAQKLLVDEEQAKTVAKIMAVLTAAQREQWKALTSDE